MNKDNSIVNLEILIDYIEENLQEIHCRIQQLEIETKNLKSKIQDILQINH